MKERIHLHRLMPILLLCVLALNTGIQPTTAVESVTNAVTLAVAGDVRAVAVQRDSAYVSAGGRIYVVDISNPLTPQIRGFVNSVSGLDSKAMAVVGDYVYAIEFNDTLNIYQIESQGQLQLVGMFENRERSANLAVYENHVYIAELGGISIIDVSDPSSPYRVGYKGNLGAPRAVSVAEDKTTGRVYAYVNGYHQGGPKGGGFRVIDVTDPSQPTEVYPCSNEDPCARFGGSSVAVLGTTAYVTHYDYMPAMAVGLTILDVSTPAAPQELGVYEMEKSGDVAVAGNRAYVMTPEGVVSIDVSDSNQPQLAAFHARKTPDFRGWLAAAGDCVYVPERTEGLTIICNTTQPFPPRKVFLPMMW